MALKVDRNSYDRICRYNNRLLRTNSTLYGDWCLSLGNNIHYRILIGADDHFPRTRVQNDIVRYYYIIAEEGNGDEQWDPWGSKRYACA